MVLHSRALGLTSYNDHIPNFDRSVRVRESPTTFPQYVIDDLELERVNERETSRE